MHTLLKYIIIDDLINSFEQVGISDGDTVMVHSSLISLGLLKDYKPAEQPSVIMNCLLDILGEFGTLVAPAFNFDFCNGEPYSVSNTPSKKMGVLSESIRKHPSALRSSHPMQSVVAIGSLAKKITDPDTSSAFSDGGSFDLMIRNHAKILLLGVPLQAASLIHWVEKQKEVPYRYWKNFTGTWISSRGKAVEKTYSLFVKSEYLKPKLNLSGLESRLHSENKMRSVSLGMSSVSAITFHDFIETASTMIENDPFVMLSNKEEVVRLYHLKKDVNGIEP